MADPQGEPTRTFVRRHQTPPSSTAWSFGATIELPPDLLAQATRRLRALTALFAFTFLMIGFAPAVVCEPCARYLWGSPERWLAGLGSIVLALGVFGLTFVQRVPPRTLVAVAGLFAIAGSYGIAFSEYQGFETGIMQQGRLGGFGLSWVSLFVVLVSVIVPTPPRRAAVVAALAVTSVPVAFLVATATGNMTVAVAPTEFFFFLVFPYVFVVVIAYTGARVVYHLGTQVQRAREMGSYQLIERLGEGGMGEVWRAEHRLLARPAAIKLVRAEMLGGGDAAVRRTALARFQREARATAAMRSPHTVQIFDYGVTDGGEFYYVMELLEGLDADSLVQRHGPLPPERVVYLLRQICESLAEAHEQGLIHRDIKPANVYVCRYGREVDFVKVLDFGLVTASRDGGGPEIRLTADNAISGTPAYMAPERVLGRMIDGRADIYAVGCLAYFLLTGRLVFEGATAIEAMMQHVEAQPVPPSRLTEVPLPDELERVVLTCLAKDPERRPASADALAARLSGVPLERVWTPQRAREWWDAHLPRPPQSAAHLA